MDTYQEIDSSVQRADARIKIALLFIYSICLFCIDTWIGLAIFTILFVIVFRASKLPLKPLLAMLVPLYIILLFTWAFNVFAFGTPSTARTFGYGASSELGGPWTDAAGIAIGLGWYFMPQGALVGCFVALRILLLTMASFLVSCTTTSTRLAEAVGAMMRPLRRLKVPVDDAALVLSLALAFIPVLGREADAIATAQRARGAHFGDNGLWTALKAWGAVFVSLFISLFRKAQRLGTALEARCYGATGKRTVLHPFALARSDWVLLVCGAFVCIVPALIW